MIQETINIKKVWTIQRFRDQAAYEAGQASEVVDGRGNVLPAVSVFENNVLLNEGIALMLSLLIGGAGTPFSNANSYMGVGDSTTAAAAAQTGLQAATNKLYKAASATYPQISGQTVTWQAAFAADEANFDWREFTVANGNSDAAVNFNRKVENQGTKASGQVWTLSLAITVS